MKTKKDKEYSFRHTQERLKERYNLDITRKEYETICKNTKICSGVLQEMSERPMKVVTIEFKNKKVRFNYDIKKDYITTVLPS